MIKCALCRFMRQFAMNLLLIADHILNTILLGHPNETISRRVARASKSGKRWAKFACKILAFAFGRDHCAYCLKRGSVGKQLWAWSKK